MVVNMKIFLTIIMSSMFITISSFADQKFKKIECLYDESRFNNKFLEFKYNSDFTNPAGAVFMKYAINKFEYRSDPYEFYEKPDTIEISRFGTKRFTIFRETGEMRDMYNKSWNCKKLEASFDVDKFLLERIEKNKQEQLSKNKF